MMRDYRQVLERQIEILEAAIRERKRQLETTPEKELNAVANMFALYQSFSVPEEAVSVQINF